MGRRGALGVVFVLALAVIVGAVPLVRYSVNIPPASSSVTGYSTLLYSLAGIGGGPFPTLVLVQSGGQADLVHFQGAKVAYWEGPFVPGTALDPPGTVKVSNVILKQWVYGLLNFSAVVTNLGNRPILNLSVAFGYPTYGMNESAGGAVRYTAPSARCSVSLAPSSSCIAVVSLPQSARLLPGEYYPLLVEALSPGGGGGSKAYAAPFIFAESLELRYAGAALSPQWVQEFIQSVNQKRNATALSENRTLDEFAAFRYDSLRAGYQISDYNFTEDYVRFFGSGNYTVFEELLYPQGQSPWTFPDVLHSEAPGHWAGLMSPVFTKFGYFFGTGPSVVTGPGCPVTEVPGPNINITQFVISHGCDYVIADQVWFILILGK